MQMRMPLVAPIGEVQVISNGIGSPSGNGRATAVATNSGTPITISGSPQGSIHFYSRRRLTFPMDRSRRFSATLERQLSLVATGAGHLEQQINAVAENTSARAKNAFIRIVSYKQVFILPI